ncbi:MAG: molybdate ABC transporter substrate-binding protein [Gammaproteobacteria bacterium]
MRLIARALLVLTALTGAASLRAESVAVAFAANFHLPMQALVEAFDERHEFTLISGSTGSLYAQIVNGAPYDVFIAADSERPRLLGESGLAEAETQFTVASGQLVLWSASREFSPDANIDDLLSEEFRFLAVANPALAPYGEAARDTLVKLGLWETWSSRLVYGSNVAQAFAMTATGNAEFGLIALSQVIDDEKSGSYVIVPASLYEPINQDAILLNRGVDNPAAVALIEFLSSPRARDLIRQFGYRTNP